jgi:hypothetical protein
LQVEVGKSGDKPAESTRFRENIGLAAESLQLPLKISPEQFARLSQHVGRSLPLRSANSLACVQQNR